MTRTLMRRIKRVEQAYEPGPYLDTAFLPLIDHFVATADEKAFKVFKQGLADLCGVPLAEDEQEKAQVPEQLTAPPPPEPESAAAWEAELRDSEARRQAWIDEHVSWRPRGEPDPHYWDGDDAGDPYGRVIVDYDPFDPRFDYDDWDK